MQTAAAAAAAAAAASERNRTHPTTTTMMMTHVLFSDCITFSRLAPSPSSLYKWVFLSWHFVHEGYIYMYVVISPLTLSVHFLWHFFPQALHSSFESKEWETCSCFVHTRFTARPRRSRNVLVVAFLHALRAGTENSSSESEESSSSSSSSSSSPSSVRTRWKPSLERPRRSPRSNLPFLFFFLSLFFDLRWELGPFWSIVPWVWQKKRD